MDILIIGAGPSGLMCANEASKNANNKIVIIEQNDKIGKKLFITGKGRCNVCNNCSNQEFLSNVINNSKFLYSAINCFNSQNTIDFFEGLGTKLKIERGNRVFPVSDKSIDIINAFKKAINKKNITLKLNEQIISIQKNENLFNVKTNKWNYNFDAVVVATGGRSYSSTGSNGYGYKVAQYFGHNIIKPKPALVPIKLKNYDGSLAGLSLKNVVASIKIGNKNFTKFGEMLFTHNGVSGPIILTLSSLINNYELSNIKLSLDLKPALDFEKLDNRLIRDFETNKLRSLKNYLKELLPTSLIEYFLKSIKINENLILSNITKVQRKFLIDNLKNFSFDIECLDNIDYGIITSGGVDTKQLNPKNMESKLVYNLFFIGEVVDVDALTGGFNIQIALSTGFICGKYLAKL